MAPQQVDQVEYERRVAEYHQLLDQGVSPVVLRPLPGEEIYLTGMAGQFPDSDNMYEFRDNLHNKVDLISEDDRRWTLKHPEIPNRTGKINNVHKFDASFFGVHYKQAHTMDPMCRMVLEKAYEAVVDAGVNPKELRNTNTGVFVGACFSESEKTMFYEKIQADGFGITGCSRAMLANRISYWLGANGPSYTVDSACSSSMYALEHAYRAMKDGQCDAAIVGGTNLCLHPCLSLLFARLGVLSLEGKCRSFDNNANGYARSEAISVIFLQRARDARRMYAEVVHAKTNCDGYKEQGITFPSGKLQMQLLEEFYEEINLDPTTLSFVEAHGTGTKVGDPEELNALDQVFCKGRKTPLRIGSVKSNMGHSEPASGLCSIAKVCLSFESGVILPNLHFTSPREGVDSLAKGRMVVVSEPTPFEGGLVGINSFGFGGANCHVLLKSNPKDKINNGLPNDDLPRLVCISGRTEEAVESILNDVESRELDNEYIGLYHQIHRSDVSGHVFRGFSVLQKGEEKRVVREAQYFSGENRPIWFVFSGMGSQWPGMGTALLKIPVFAESIDKSCKVLAKKGLDLMKIITDTDPKMFDNILHSFVGIAAIQIGLVDVLTAIGIKPDFLIGHSVGELGCAYADGCFTAEQMILAAYSRGMASLETELIKGSMAAVGLGYQEMKNMCPPDVEIACHNSSTSCTISGPAESLKAFVAELQSKGIFAREVNCSNIAYHSRYIADAGPRLLKALKEVIPVPKPRSSKWLSTSVPKERWDSDLAKYSSAEYHTNNLLSSVLFEETAVHIPKNAITVEIAPHGLLQAIIKRSLHRNVINIALTQRGHRDNTHVLLQAIGKLYNLGLQPQLQEIYPPVEYPVSRGTPMISPLVRWEHSEDWFLTTYKIQEKINSGERTVVININEEETQFMSGHVIDGRNLFPATGYLWLVWETMGLIRGELYSALPVVIEDVRFLRATNIPKDGTVSLTIMIQKGTGNFEVIEGGAAVVTGRIYVPEHVEKESIDLPVPEVPHGPDDILLTKRDVYKELRLRGYNYSGMFKSIIDCDTTGTVGNIQWYSNWVAFMDNMLQMQILQGDTRGLFVPTSIQKITIDTAKHFTIVPVEYEEGRSVPAYVYKDIGIIKSGGVEIRGLKASAIGRRKPLGEPVLEKYEFVPLFNRTPLSESDAVRVCIQLALENVPMLKVKAVEVDDGVSQPLAETIALTLGDLPLIQSDITVISDRQLELQHGVQVENKQLASESACLLVIAHDLLSKPEVLDVARGILRDEGFVISREKKSAKPNKPVNFEVVTETVFGDEKLVLLKKSIENKKRYVVVNVGEKSDKPFEWLEQIKDAVKTNKPFIAYSEKDPINGIQGFVNCVRKEPGGEFARGVFIIDDNAPTFDQNNPFYKKQLDLGLAVNVYKNGAWGTFRHLQLDKSALMPCSSAYVDVTVRGDLSSLSWIEGGLTNSTDKNLVEVYNTALNFRDIMTATGKLAVEVIAHDRLQDCVQGLEFAGRDRKGRRLMGMLPGGALATRVVCDPDLTWEVPNDWSFEDAVTVPVTYCTAIYAMVVKGKMKRGSRVLIHAGSGGVGQAAINLALHYDCEVFTTVGTPEKREFLKKRFPQLKDDHIGNSRDTSFEQMIMDGTDGNGVDMVLNSLAEEKLLASVRCLARGGKFFEIGKFDLANNTPLGMETFLRETSFFGIMLDNMFFAPHSLKNNLAKLLYEGIKDGYVKPLPRTVFSENEIEQAFRYMAAGKHLGKVLIHIRPEEGQKTIIPKEHLVQAKPKFYCDRTKSYVIAGGLGGFGLELTDYLVLRGAKKIVLTSRKGLTKGYQASRIRCWRSYGVEVKISVADITTHEGCAALLHTANLLGPVDAVFNLAVVLKDAILENQTVENYQTSFGPKATATAHLDKVSRKMCPSLRHFVVFSSVSCGRGNAGQTNYGMANSVMERICEKRKSEGLPALAVQWGAIGEVGLVADMQDNDGDLEIGGTLQQRISSCLETLDLFLKEDTPIVASMVVAEKKSGSGGAKNVMDAVVNIMGIRDLKTISMHTNLAELGMDSMMAVEIKQTLEREFEVFLTAQDIRGLTFAKLAEIAAQQEGDSGMTSAGDQAANANEAIGINFLMRTIGDESTADLPVIQLSSSALPDSPSTVFLLPGIEGMATVLEPLAQKLSSHALCLQFDYKEPVDTIEEIAQQLLPVIKTYLEPNQPFKIAAYSYGTLVALELAYLLEAEGKEGDICFIDGAPELMKELVILNLPMNDDNKLQIIQLCGIMDLVAPQNTAELKVELEQTTDWEGRLDLLMAHSPNQKHSKEYQRAMCIASYKRLKSVIAYEPDYSRKLKSKITLIRPKQHTVPGLKDDYRLSDLTSKPVTVEYVNGNHATILEEQHCAEIINSTLSTVDKITLKQPFVGSSEFQRNEITSQSTHKRDVF